MIVFDLRCAPQGHVFEAWFGSSAAYGEQRQRGLVSCPLCGSEQVEKAVMAPRVSAKGNRKDEPSSAARDMISGEPEAVKEALAALAAAQKKILEASDYVGESFADEARAIHLGEVTARSIYGKATPQQAESLAEEGISITPLPFPVAEPGQEN
jgi:hypothetical protein